MSQNYQKQNGRCGRRGLPKAIVQAMYEDYLELGSVEKVGRKYGRSRQSMWEIFSSRGLKLRPKTFQRKVFFDGVPFTLHGGRSGYLTATQGRRRPLHHVVWEKHNGRIPRGHNVCLRDGNPFNCSVENLVCLPFAEARRLQTQRGRSRVSVGKIARNISPELIRQLHSKYEGGASLRALAAQVNRSATCLAGLFRRLGLSVRESSRLSKARRDGTHAPAPVHSLTDILDVADSLPRLYVPKFLKRDWRLLPLEHRGLYIRRIRERIQTRRDQPRLPFSANVLPFDYATPEAQAIVAQSRSVASLKLCSQGVIWNGELWHWEAQIRAYRTHNRGFRALHREVWRAANGRSVPRDCYVCCADGNPNNVDPSNLVLRTRAELVTEHTARYFIHRSREKTALLLKRSQARDSGSADTLGQILSVA